jgi:hypothetical protein
MTPPAVNHLRRRSSSVRWIATTASWLTSVIAASSRQNRGSAAA